MRSLDDLCIFSSLGVLLQPYGAPVVQRRENIRLKERYVIYLFSLVLMVREICPIILLLHHDDHVLSEGQV